MQYMVYNVKLGRIMAKRPGLCPVETTAASSVGAGKPPFSSNFSKAQAISELKRAVSGITQRTLSSNSAICRARESSSVRIPNTRREWYTPSLSRKVSAAFAGQMCHWASRIRCHGIEKSSELPIGYNKAVLLDSKRLAR